MSAPSSGKKVKHVTSACDSCREAKAKCDLNSPCSRCLSRKSKCKHTKVIDGRSQRSELKRKVTELEHESSVLRDIIDHLRESPEEDVAKVVTLIRSGANLPEIHQCIQQHLDESRLHQRELSPPLVDLNLHIKNTMEKQSLLNASEDQLEQQPSKRVLDVARLIDDPLYRVPAHPWTQVTDDKDLVSHLVSCWSSWRNITHIGVAEQHFIHDMQAGQLDCQYCSPFLVNCVLAFGCFYSDYSEARTRSGVISQLTRRFIAEAKRLWEEEAEQTSITTAQGLSVLFTLIAMSNEDALSLDLIAKLTDLSQKLAQRYVPSSEWATLTYDDAVFQHVLNVTCWGTFNVTTIARLSYQKTQHMKTPPEMSSFKSLGIGDADRHWTGYPSDSDPLRLYERETFDAFCDLAVLAKELAHKIFPEGPSNKEQHEVELGQSLVRSYNCLQSWQAELPEKLQPTKKVTPLVLSLQAWYYYLCLLVMNALKQSQAATSEPRFLSIISEDLAASLMIVKLCRLHRKSWGIDRMNVVVAQSMLCALNRLCADLPNSAYSEEITDLCVYMRAIGRRIPIVISMLRMFQLDMLQQGKQLPAKTESLFQEFEKSELREFDDSTVNSNWPLLSWIVFRSREHEDTEVGNRSNSTNAKNMGEFLRLTSALSLNDNAVNGS